MGESLSTQKLVRDRDPERVLRREEKRMNVRPAASDKEFRQLLAEKLFEEAEEFFRIPSTEELADISTVLEYIYSEFGFDAVRVQSLQRGRCPTEAGKLYRALVEQAQLFAKEQMVDALADFTEILSIIETMSPSFEPRSVAVARAQKREERGEFTKRLVWDRTYS